MPATYKPKGLFITGTGTGVGKTIFSAALALMLKKKGIDVGVMKPLESGVDDVSQAGDDGALLRWAAACTEPLEAACPYRFNTAAAPGTASRNEKHPVDYSALVDTTKQLIARHQFTIIEGAGGLMVPIAGGFLISDLARDAGLPVLVVADVQLGTINHSLLTLLAARYFDLDIAGYVLNRMPKDPDVAQKSAPHDLASLTIEELLAVLPEISGNPQQKVEAIAALIPELPSWPLLRRILPQTV